MFLTFKLSKFFASFMKPLPNNSSNMKQLQFLEGITCLLRSFCHFSLYFHGLDFPFSSPSSPDPLRAVLSITNARENYSIIFNHQVLFICFKRRKKNIWSEQCLPGCFYMTLRGKRNVSTLTTGILTR